MIRFRLFIVLVLLVFLLGCEGQKISVFYQETGDQDEILCYQNSWLSGQLGLEKDHKYYRSRLFYAKRRIGGDCDDRENAIMFQLVFPLK